MVIRAINHQTQFHFHGIEPQVQNQELMVEVQNQQALLHRTPLHSAQGNSQRYVWLKWNWTVDHSNNRSAHSCKFYCRISACLCSRTEFLSSYLSFCICVHQVPRIRTNALLVGGEEEAPPNEKQTLPEIPEVARSNQTDSAFPVPTFPLRLTAPTGGLPQFREIDLGPDRESHRVQLGPTHSKGFGSF